MNIDKIITHGLKYSYVYRIEQSLNQIGLIFIDLKGYLKVGSSNLGRRDAAFKSYFGNDARIPRHVESCLCCHEITEQCYLCPEGSKNIDDILVVGNRCIQKWGYDPAVRGKGVKIKCECCGATVNKSGIKRPQETLKCRNRRDTASNISTSAGSEDYVKII